MEWTVRDSHGYNTHPFVRLHAQMAWSRAVSSFCAKDKVVFDPDIGAFRRDPIGPRGRIRAFRGVIPVLERQFFGRRRASLMHGSGGRGRSRASGLTGAERGRMVDQQMEQVVKLMETLRVTPSGLLACCSNTHRRRGVDVIRRAWSRLLERLDPLVVSIVHELSRRRLVPIAAQCPVASAHLRIATAADLVCASEIGFRWTGPVPGSRITIVEIKTGYRDADRASGVRMKPPFTTLVDNPLNRHRLQLAVTHMLFRRCVKPERRQLAVMPPLLLYIRDQGGAVAYEDLVSDRLGTDVWNAIRAARRV